jgi:hypothetical protein
VPQVVLDAVQNHLLRLLQLTRPAPVVSVDPPIACAIANTTSNIIVANPTVVP